MESRLKTESVLNQIIFDPRVKEVGYKAPLELRRSLSEKTTVERLPAAVCALFKGQFFKDAKILLTERSHSLPTHAGHVAFPGGVFEAQDQGNAVLAAHRECEEEVGLPLAYMNEIGVLPCFPTLVGDFEVTPVISIWSGGESKFVLSSEVIAVEWVSVQELFQTRQIEMRQVKGIEVESPYFWWGEKKIWGVTAWIFDLIYQRYVILNS